MTEPEDTPLPKYEPARLASGFVRVALYSFAITLAILFLIPFTQYITGLVDGGPELRSVDIVPPPPPPPPEVEDPPEETPPEESPPELTEPPPPLDFAQLDVALEAGVGDAVAGSFGFGGFAVQPDAVADLQLFDVRDLDEVPRPVRQVKMVPPIRFKRERISGLVRLEIQIDEEGRTTVLDVVETSHSDLNEPATEAAEQWLWTPPKKNGKAVRARYFFPMGFKF